MSQERVNAKDVLQGRKGEAATGAAGTGGAGGAGPGGRTQTRVVPLSITSKRSSRKSPHDDDCVMCRPGEEHAADHDLIDASVHEHKGGSGRGLLSLLSREHSAGSDDEKKEAQPAAGAVAVTVAPEYVPPAVTPSPSPAPAGKLGNVCVCAGVNGGRRSMCIIRSALQQPCVCVVCVCIQWSLQVAHRRCRPERARVWLRRRL